MANLLPVASGELAGLANRAAAQAVAENFPVALRVLPAGPRVQLARVYAFARFVDDVGDEAAGDRGTLLAAVEADLRSLAERGRAELAPVAGLRPVLDAGVPVQPFLDLVTANIVDQAVTAYETLDDLLGYCALSAAPVGRVVLHLAGAATPANLADSDRVCAALQILEHCQDVGEDARAGRVYLPAEDLRANGVDPATLSGATTSAGLRDVVARQVLSARSMLRSGGPLVARLSGWGRLAVAGYVAGGRATAAALAKNRFDVLYRDIRPGRTATAVRAAGLIVGGRRGR